ncbi:hypothetical protein HY642_06530 [Candidatus Woesearchaeota archaeon]|nr:hypothetical protein [Candidatus Woesearchaeota archaeon]
MARDLWLEFAGNTPLNRLLGLMLTGREFEYTLTDLATKSDISWSTLHRIFPRLVKTGIVLQTRQIGRAKLYKLSAKNPVVVRLVALYDTILLQAIQRMQEKELILAQ